MEQFNNPPPKRRRGTTPEIEIFAPPLPLLMELKPLPDTHPFYALIGRVAAEWAWIEHILDLLIWEMARTTQAIGSCITGSLLGQGGRFSSVLALATLHGCDRKMLGRIDHLSNKANGLSRRRNRFVHDAWYIRGDAKVGQFKSFQKDGKFGWTEVTEEYAKDTISEFRKLATKVSDLRVDILKESPPA